MNLSSESVLLLSCLSLMRSFIFVKYSNRTYIQYSMLVCLVAISSHFERNEPQKCRIIAHPTSTQFKTWYSLLCSEKNQWKQSGLFNFEASLGISCRKRLQGLINVAPFKYNSAFRISFHPQALSSLFLNFHWKSFHEPQFEDDWKLGWRLARLWLTTVILLANQIIWTKSNRDCDWLILACLILEQSTVDRRHFYSFGKESLVGKSRPWGNYWIPYHKTNNEASTELCSDVRHSRSRQKDSTSSRVFPYTTFVLYRLLRALRQNTGQSKLRYLLRKTMVIATQRFSANHKTSSEQKIGVRLFRINHKWGTFCEKKTKFHRKAPRIFKTY